MRPLQDIFLISALLIAMLVLGAGIERNFGPPNDAHEKEIAMNEDACNKNNKVKLPSDVGYPVTHWGELRGCILIHDDGTPAFFQKLDLLSVTAPPTRAADTQKQPTDPMYPMHRYREAGRNGPAQKRGY